MPPVAAAAGSYCVGSHPAALACPWARLLSFVAVRRAAAWLARLNLEWRPLDGGRRCGHLRAHEMKPRRKTEHEIAKYGSGYGTEGVRVFQTSL